MHFAKDNDGILYKVRDDNSVRPVTADDPCYLEWVNNEGVLVEMPVVIPTTPTDEELASQIRFKRNQLIAETDYLVMPDYPITEERKQKVLTYRQALRDITTQETFPQSVVWPILED